MPLLYISDEILKIKKINILGDEMLKTEDWNIPDDERQWQHQAGNVGRGLAHSAARGGAPRFMIFLS